MGTPVFSRQEYKSRFSFPTPGDIPDPGIEPASPAMAGGSFTNCTTWEALYKLKAAIKKGMADIFHMKSSQTTQR